MFCLRYSVVERKFGNFFVVFLVFFDGISTRLGWGEKIPVLLLKMRKVRGLVTRRKVNVPRGKTVATRTVTTAQKAASRTPRIYDLRLTVKTLQDTGCDVRETLCRINTGRFIFWFLFVFKSGRRKADKFFSVTWNIILADSLKLLSTGESTGTVVVNCSSNWDVSSALFCRSE